jgi:NAD(P)-dependent dehydrogenase (short-subunit alcohol dehydrogenase family)
MPQDAAVRTASIFLDVFNVLLVLLDPFEAERLGGESMTTAPTTPPVEREPRLLGQTVVVIGGSAGIGLETACLARGEGAEVVLTGRTPGRLEQAARDVGARSSAAFDADDAASLKRFFDELPAPIDHVLIAAYTSGAYAPLLERTSEEVGRAVGRRVTQVLEIARRAAPKMRPGGTLLLTGGSVKKIDREAGITPAAFAVLPPFTAALALELAPVRVNLIQAGFVDTALAASYFAEGGDVEARREDLRATLPIGRVVGPADVAALAVHLMINTAITGATYDIDGGQQLIA